MSWRFLRVEGTKIDADSLLAGRTCRNELRPPSEKYPERLRKLQVNNDARHFELRQDSF